jgi:hypothetical protein
MSVSVRRWDPYVISRSGIVSVDGAFTLGGIPEGRYGFVLANLPADLYVGDLRLGGRSIYAEGMIEVGTQPLPNVEIVLRKGGGTIEGVVQDSQKRAVPSDVYLVPETARRRNPMFYKSTRAGAGGHFSITALPPGEYKVFAWDILPPSGAMENTDFIAQYEQRGIPVTVRDGATISVAVPEIPAP